MGAADLFQGIVAAEDVRHGKPDPEVFLLAASRLRLPPGHCIVVEDAAAGLEAARRAGMRCTGVHRGARQLTADVVVSGVNLLESDAFEKLLPFEPRA